jgi:hypothetical protein
MNTAYASEAILRFAFLWAGQAQSHWIEVDPIFTA